MSLEAKQEFVRNVLKGMESVLTIDTMRHLSLVLDEQVTRFDIENTHGDSAFTDASEYMDLFFNAKLLEGRSQKTIRLYRFHITKFFKATQVPVQSVSIFHLRAYLSSQKARGLADKTIESARLSFSSFFGWLYKEGLIQKNPCQNLSSVKCQKEIKLPFSSTDVERLRTACENERDTAVVYFLLGTGCRISEMCSLNRDSIDLARGEAIVFGKGAKERKVFLDEVGIMYLKRYLDKRVDDNQSLFVGLRAPYNRVTSRGMEVMLKRLESLSGVENVHPHRFRRTLATNLISRGMPLNQVSAILGHEKIDTTMRYVYTAQEELKNSYKKYA